MKLTEMRALLGERDIRLTKSLGQNFLHDRNQLRKITAAADLAPTDKVLEIGPGLGPLTELLVEQAGHVLAIEKDARLVPLLQEHFASAAGLELLHADALEVVRDHGRDWSDWKLVANLPYSVASPILIELAQNPRGPRLLVATLQLEVARRLTARAGEDDYGVLTLLMALRYQPGAWFRIPRACFFPEPDIDSACIVLRRRATPLLPQDTEATFEKIVKRAFSERRKQMAKLLKLDWPADQVTRALDGMQIRPDVRGEKLSLEQFVALTKNIAADGR